MRAIPLELSCIFLSNVHMTLCIVYTTAKQKKIMCFFRFNFAFTARPLLRPRRDPTPGSRWAAAGPCALWSSPGRRCSTGHTTSAGWAAWRSRARTRGSGTPGSTTPRQGRVTLRRICIVYVRLCPRHIIGSFISCFSGGQVFELLLLAFVLCAGGVDRDMKCCAIMKIRSNTNHTTLKRSAARCMPGRWTKSANG